MSAEGPGAKLVDMSSVKIAVFTCITQGYDTLTAPQTVDERLDYYCFTDSPASVKPPWKFVPIVLRALSPKDQNRYIKMHPHEFLPGYDITVYVDGNIQIVGDVYALVQSVLDAPEDIFLFRHPWRNCLYAEAAACGYFAHDWIWNIASQMRSYSAAGFPVEQGLFEGSVIIRKDTAGLRSLMDAWWTEYTAGIKRDQLSFTYVAWSLGISVGSLGENDARFGHRHFQFVERPRTRKLKLTVRRHINTAIAALLTYEKLFKLSTPVRWKR